MLEIDYDAAEARANWQQVETLANSLHHYDLATRARENRELLLSCLGDTETAKKQVVVAWGLSKLRMRSRCYSPLRQCVRAGPVRLHRYEEALTPLNEAIKLAASQPDKIGYPTIAMVREDRCVDRPPSPR